MSFLPILSREVQLRAHSPAHHWVRVAVGFIAILVLFPLLVSAGQVASPASDGKLVFRSLRTLAFLYACAACLFTSDTVSRERREGTLDLLLVTPVRPLQILLGKLVSAGLSCVEGLIAFLPLLAVPLLMGGTSPGEISRTWLVLVNTVFLALSVGIFVSAYSVDRFRAACASIFWMAALVAAPSILGVLGRPMTLLHVFTAAGDAQFRMSPTPFWIDCCLIAVVSGLHLGAAVIGMRQRKSAIRSVEAASALAELQEDPAARVPCPYCGRENLARETFCGECGTRLFPEPLRKPGSALTSATTPLHWLIGRRRGPELLLWVAAALCVIQLGIMEAFPRLVGLRVSPRLMWLGWWIGLLPSVVAGCLVAWAASRFVVEAKATGEIETLLTTPLGAEELMKTQWDVLKRAMAWPLFAMLLPILIVVCLSAMSSRWIGPVHHALLLSLRSANLVLSIAALCWVALACAFEGLSQAKTIMRAVLAAYSVPFLIGLSWIFLNMLTIPRMPGPALVLSHPLLGLYPILSQLITLAVYLRLIRVARSRLLQPVTYDRSALEGSRTIAEVGRWAFLCR